MGLEEDRCTEEGQQTNLAFREQCLLTFNADQRLAYDTITACIVYTSIKKTRNFLKKKDDTSRLSAISIQSWAFSISQNTSKHEIHY